MQAKRKGKSLLGLLRIDGLNEAKQSAQRLTKGSLEFEIYESIVNPDRTFVVLNRVDEDDARTVEEHLMFAVTANERLRTRVFDTCQIQRDYGRFDRAQAPQYFPPIPRPTR